MKQSIIFVFILLVTLSVVNAIPHNLYKRQNGGGGDGKTKFLPCPKGDPLTVEMSPNPAEPGKEGTYKISGELTETIPEGSILFIAFVDPSSKPAKLIGNPFIQELCDSDNVKCPVDGGTSFRTKVNYTTPNDLPDSYVIIVAVVDPDKRLLGCAYAAVGDVKSYDHEQIVNNIYG